MCVIKLNYHFRLKNKNKFEFDVRFSKLTIMNSISKKEPNSTFKLLTPGRKRSVHFRVPPCGLFMNSH